MLFSFVTGSESDVQALNKLPLSAAPKNNIYGGLAYTDYTIEEGAIRDERDGS